MKTWQKILAMIAVAVLIAGVRIYFVFKAREDPGVLQKKNDAAQKMSQDDLVVMKEHFYSSFDSAKDLVGTTAWVKAGYSLPYYPYAGGTVQFAKRAGELPSAEKLTIQKLVKASPPAKEDDRFPHGSKQYFIVFSLEGNPDAKPGQWAAPIGYADGGDEHLQCDLLFYYDDPRKIYDHWPKDVWDAVATHTPKVGLNELQTQMVVGMLMDPQGASVGNRTVIYDANGKKWTVTFVKGVATDVKAG